MWRRIACFGFGWLVGAYIEDRYWEERYSTLLSELRGKWVSHGGVR